MLNTVMDSNTVLVDTAVILNQHTLVCQLYLAVSKQLLRFSQLCK